MKKLTALLMTIVMAFALSACGEEGLLQAQPPKAGEEIAIMKTSKGEIRIKFFPKEAPKAVENFITLAKDGYYDGLTFHRVIKDFMVQGGDPTGDGTGGESMWGEAFEDEVSPKLHFFRGALAMANAGPDTNGSQFFMVQPSTVDANAIAAIEEALKGEEIMQVPLPNGKPIGLDDLYTEDVLKYYNENGGYIGLEYVFSGAAYTIFAQIYEGLDVLDSIAAVETDANDKPLEDVTIQSITFEEFE